MKNFKRFPTNFKENFSQCFREFNVILMKISDNFLKKSLIFKEISDNFHKNFTQFSREFYAMFRRIVKKLLKKFHENFKKFWRISLNL